MQEMKEITYQESIDLMGFADGHDDILIMMPQQASALTLPELRKLANAGAKFFLPDPEVALDVTEEVNIIPPLRSTLHRETPGKSSM